MVRPSLEERGPARPTGVDGRAQRGDSPARNRGEPPAAMRMVRIDGGDDRQLDFIGTRDDGDNEWEEGWDIEC